jgi:hypothetical protein
MGSPRNVLMIFFQFYVEHDLRKNKIVVLFICQQINFYELIFRFLMLLKLFFYSKLKPND